MRVYYSDYGYGHNDDDYYHFNIMIMYGVIAADVCEALASETTKPLGFVPCSTSNRGRCGERIFKQGATERTELCSAV